MRLLIATKRDLASKSTKRDLEANGVCHLRIKQQTTSKSSASYAPKIRSSESLET